MKTLILITASVLFLTVSTYCQIPDNSIKKIAWKHMVENKELSPKVDIRDQKNITLSVYDYKNEVYIVDPEITVLPTDTLSYYRIHSIDAHTSTRFMFTKGGKWAIISMGGSLPVVMAKGVEACQELGLDFYESLYVFKEILTYKELYYDDSIEGMIIE